MFNQLSTLYPPSTPKKNSNRHNRPPIDDQTNAITLTPSSVKRIHSSSKKRLSLNHLLNFSFSPLQNVSHTNPSFRKTLFQPYDKHKFVRAAFRFIVPCDLSLSDIEHLQWDSISAIEYLTPTTDPLRCAICLDSAMVAPRMTLCGHVYCLPCILECHSFSDDPERQKCPLCNEIVKLANIKRVVFRQFEPIVEGQSVTMRKMYRNRSRLHPFRSRENAQSGVVPHHMDHVDAKFSQLTVASLEYDYQREEKKQLLQLKEQSFSSVFIDTSLRHLENTEHCTDTGESKEQPIDETKVYCFFQSDDGQFVFTSSLTYRCLMYEFGGHERVPDFINAKVLDKEDLVQNEDTRQKYRFLNHLPNGCAFTFLELDLSEILSSPTVAFFSEELLALSHRNHKPQVKTVPKPSPSQPIPIAAPKNHILQFTVPDESLDEAFPCLSESPSEIRFETGSRWSSVAEKGFASGTWTPLSECRPPQLTQVKTSTSWSSRVSL